MTEHELKYWQRVRSSPEKRNCTAEELLQRLINSGYVIDDENREIVEKLILYFSGNKEGMRSVGIDPEKGIALVGPPGVGKTMLMRLLRYNSHAPFALVNCYEIADKCESGGSENIAEHFIKRKPARPELYYGNEFIGSCFNELGRETIPVKYFGNPTNVLGKIMFNRYENQLPFTLTHFTSNKSADEIEHLYGDFIRDRFREMFNWVAFDKESKSRRK